eukprot:TRINITY_DN9654_c0_g1_i1.p1 TRINITY_DN9654_c0_g1~~TRINITY_DN9654_c0_g1_i1.p1  ORF type:complete len:235 (-),score=58.74 TRINITY_DN9654_c0_g1_i1:57-761(-)
MDPEADLTSECFRDDRFLARSPVTPQNVFEYFSKSPFYSKDSNNQVLRMQGIPWETIPETLRVLIGKQYVLEKSVPPRLYTIKRIRRQNPEECQVTGMYYIIDGTIYESPTLLATLEAKLDSCVYHLQEALNTVKNFVEFDSIEGYSWNSTLGKSEEKETSDKGNQKSEDGLAGIELTGTADAQRMEQFITMFSKHHAPTQRMVSVTEANKRKRPDEIDTEAADTRPMKKAKRL